MNTFAFKRYNKYMSLIVSNYLYITGNITEMQFNQLFKPQNIST